MSNQTIGKLGLDAMEARLLRVESHIDTFGTRFTSLDKKVDCLTNGVEILKAESAANMQVTTQVRDILTSFKTLTAVSMKFAAWGTAMGAAVLMAIQLWQKLTGKA